ncbi:MAG: hypothetical protein O3C52_08300 [Proteobacteria bacterium]|nr:hypothetical protein [Pseudomonadota bacterium]MDA0913971.1 hypothetical protein [Pseudomonadota bacterium]MDA1033346.1 hypothetical protein [Pseudomonadota bacterium]
MGEGILLRIDGVHTPVGKFVWVDGRYAGIVFEGKMHPAVVDFLRNQNAKTKEQKKAGKAA